MAPIPLPSKVFHQLSSDFKPRRKVIQEPRIAPEILTITKIRKSRPLLGNNSLRKSKAIKIPMLTNNNSDNLGPYLVHDPKQ